MEYFQSLSPLDAVRAIPIIDVLRDYLSPCCCHRLATAPHRFNSDDKTSENHVLENSQLKNNSLKCKKAEDSWWALNYDFKFFAPVFASTYSHS